MRTITLTTDQLTYLTALLESSTGEGTRFENRVLERGHGVGDEWPEEEVEAAHERARIAQSILESITTS